MYRAVGWLLIVLASGCIGLSAGGRAGMSVSRSGNPRFHASAPLGLHVRTNTKEHSDDVSRLFFLAVEPRVTYQPGVAWAAGPATSLGYDVFQGHWGVMGRLTVGGLFNRTDERLALRFELGVEREIGGSDWRIDKVERCGPSEAPGTNQLRDSTHSFVGFSPGIEFLERGNTDPGGWSLSLMMSYRRMTEPGCT